MILSEIELAALVERRHGTPHDLLGMHRLESRRGVVVRALLPSARAVMAVPLHELKCAAIPLRRIGTTDLFEGIATDVSGVCAYDLAVQWENGEQTRTRDPYSFLPTLSEADLFLFGKGDERRIYNKLGAHLRQPDGVPGASFAVWAPNAQRVSVKGAFNSWRGDRHLMRHLGASGVWELFVPGVQAGDHYKFEILTAAGRLQEKTDPFGFFFELAPKNSAIVWDTHKFAWSDEAWCARRAAANPLRSPMSIYEMHLGSWRKKRKAESFSYLELAGPLIDYLRRMGFTHVEFMPVAEHAYYPSWGYQVTGFYAPTSRYGTPDDFQHLINALHEAGIGVLMDWVPAHFPRDDWALARFDGTALYEHADPRRGEHPDWGTLVFDFARNEVRNFLVANALYWCDVFHVDGLRTDAVASMLHLDYSRKPGEWVPNIHGDNRNLDAVEFLQHANQLIHDDHPGVVTIAEESTNWPKVTRPVEEGGLGFTFKWDLGWMHDTLQFFQHDPVHRQWHQDSLTFSTSYQRNENYLRPLSHDEVVHGKRSLLGRMPGDDWQRFANLRALLGSQWCLPGKQLIFMGGEFGQSAEWDENGELHWALLGQGPYHCGLQQYVADLNRVYKQEPALWDADYEEGGFYWLDCNDRSQSVLTFIRQNTDGTRRVLVLLNLTPVPRYAYRVGLPCGGFWRELINSDAASYGGSNCGNHGGVQAQPVPWHAQPFSVEFILPPLSCVILSPE